MPANNNSQKPTILITGGHMTPAMAVISELKKRGEYKFIWVGHKFNQFGNRNPSAEFQAITKLGITFVDLKAGKLTRNWSGDNWIAGLTNLVKIPWGLIHSLWIILKYRPTLIMSFGGYLALPIVVAGRLLGKKVLTHEQTSVTGLTNRIIPKFAHKVLISWPSSTKFYPLNKTILTGNPLRPEIFEQKSNKIRLNPNLPTIYVTGGNQGSHLINQAIFMKLNKILEIANIIHQTGDSSATKDYDQAIKLKEQVKGNSLGIYYPQPFFYKNEIGEVFSKSDLVVSRSGANTVYEILALGKRTIFIPIPWVTHKEQLKNAELAVKTGIATILEEKHLSPDSLLQEINATLELIAQNRSFSREPITQAFDAAKSIIKYNAAKLIVDQITEILTKKILVTSNET